MTWNDPQILGAKSVAFHENRINQNNAYIETTMQVDHFWDGDPGGDANKDGHHQFVQMPKLASTPFSLAVADNMNGAIYVEDKAKIDTTDENSLFYVNSNGHTSLLGIRAAANVEGTTLKWEHNVSSVTSSGEGLFTVNWTNALPSNNYCISVIAYRPSTGLTWEIQGGGTWDTNVTTTFVNLRFKDQSNIPKNPIRFSIFAIGG